MVGDNPHITDFKADPSVAGLLTMLKSSCTNTTSQSETSASTSSTSNLLSELEDADKASRKRRCDVATTVPADKSGKKKRVERLENHGIS